MKKSLLISSLSDVGNTLLGTAINYALWLTAYISAMSIPQSTWGQAWRAQRTADRFLDSVNYEQLRQAIANARRRGLVKRIRRNGIPVITSLGYKRLSQRIPTYQEKRPWDRKLYLVTYDIPEKRRSQRNILRSALKRIGCGMLQDSVWLTPYNPVDILKDYDTQYNFLGTVIISSIGKDGWVGDENISDLLIRVYKLKELNQRYENFLSGTTFSSFEATIQFLSILKDDPQLPFELLPRWWKGDRAYQGVKIMVNKMYFQMRPHQN